MNRTGYILAPLLLLGSLSLFSGRAFGYEIPFYISNPTVSTGEPFECYGPWFRVSNSVGPLAPRTPRRHFYSAQETAFSAYGYWQCGTVVTRLIAFCVYPFSSPPTVELSFSTSSEGLRLKSNQPGPPCTIAAASAFLGDASPQGQTGEGAFRVEGTAGDTVTVTLDHDGSQGSTGEVAQLRLTTEAGATLAQQQGAVPLVLQATLPSSGTFETEVVEVLDSAAGSGGAFRGYYLLSVTDISGNGIQLEPLPSTQP